MLLARCTPRGELHRMSRLTNRRPLRLVALATLLLPLATQAKDAAVESKSFLWKVTAKDGRSLHLFGSIHMADASMYPLPAAVEETFAASQVLVVEADIENVDAAGIMQLTMRKAALPDGRKLSQVVSKETWALVEKSLDGLMPAAALEPFQPWFAAMTIASTAIKKAGLDPALGLDRHFLSRRGDRKVVELEGVTRQIEMLSGFDLAQQEKLLVWTIADMDSMKRELDTLIAAWKIGDTKALEKIVTESTREHPEAKPVVDLLIHKRNAEMTKKVEKMLQTAEREFVVVGAAHLVGDSGIVRQLAKKGYRVEQL